MEFVKLLRHSTTRYVKVAHGGASHGGVDEASSRIITFSTIADRSLAGWALARCGTFRPTTPAITLCYPLQLNWPSHAEVMLRS